MGALLLVGGGIVIGLLIGEVRHQFLALEAEKARLLGERDALQARLEGFRAKERPSWAAAMTEDLTAPLAAATKEVEALVTARDFLQLRVDSADRSLRLLHQLFDEIRNGSYRRDQPTRRSDGKGRR